MLSTHPEMRGTRFAEKVRAHTLRSPVAIVDVFQLLVHHADTTASNVYMVVENGTVCTTTIKRRVDVQLSESVFSPCFQLAAVIRPQGHIGSGKWGF